jgi:hypothetical protein
MHSKIVSCHIEATEGRPRDGGDDGAQGRVCLRLDVSTAPERYRYYSWTSEPKRLRHALYKQPCG